MRITERSYRQRGSQVVELAISLPLLLLLVFAIIEGSSFVRVHQVINNAAREGAHFAAIQENVPAANSDIQTIVKQYATNNGVDSSKLTITIDQGLMIPMPSGITMPASEVVVTFPYTLQYMPRIPFTSFPSSITLRASAEFRNFH